MSRCTNVDSDDFFGVLLGKEVVELGISHAYVIEVKFLPSVGDEGIVYFVDDFLFHYLLLFILFII